MYPVILSDMVDASSSEVPVEEIEQPDAPAPGDQQQGEDVDEDDEEAEHDREIAPKRQRRDVSAHDLWAYLSDGSSCSAACV